MKTEQEILEKLHQNGGRMRIISGSYNKKAIKNLLENGFIKRETIKKYDNGIFSTYVFIMLK